MTAFLLCLSVSHLVAHDGCAQQAKASCCRAKATKQVEQQEATPERAAVPTTVADREQGTADKEGCCRKSSSAAKTAAKFDSCHDDEATQAQDGCCSTRSTTEEGPSSSEEAPQ